MYQSDELQKKWQPVLEHQDLPEIKDAHKRAVTATLLENQEKSAREQHAGTGGYNAPSLLGEAAPANATGSDIANFDPVLISLVRRSMPNLIAYDICGVQPMSGPTGLIFAMRSKFTTQGGTEALFNEAPTHFSASAQANTASQSVVDGAAGTSQTGTDPTAAGAGTGYTVGQGMATGKAEALGDGAASAFQQSDASTDELSVTSYA